MSVAAWAVALGLPASAAVAAWSVGRVTATAGTAWDSEPSAASNVLLVTVFGVCVPL